ncbi:MAG: site-specific DNA-methyltransferase, partial [Firmicutes bacterium]|nr:site-specific DNA-methyltransferase [Candidatus Fermentithermobacillaceae bacterium]
LRVFRTEALRAGFKACWVAKDYKTIVEVARRIPDSVLQEDSALLMYHDNALILLGER